MTLWEVDVYPAEGQVDSAGQALAAEARDLGLEANLSIASVRGFLLQGDLSEEQVRLAAMQLLADPITESISVARVGDASLAEGDGILMHVLLLPGVMDPVAISTLQALQDLSLPVEEVATFRKYWLRNCDAESAHRVGSRLLSNDSIERVHTGQLALEKLDVGSAYDFQLQLVAIRDLNDQELMELSKSGQLYLTLAEMRTIQEQFRQQDREPTDIELETIAQTWSEHCSHKTLAGRIAYNDEKGQRSFENMLKETIFEATRKIRQDLGENDWCVKVFSDNAGIVRFDDDYHVVFKVETHNHPSAIEPYGGANTGIGGVIRDPLGTGLGAKPFCNTDVFCFAPPDMDPQCAASGRTPPQSRHEGRRLRCP